MIPGYLSPLVNHLWQSTIFAAVAGILTLALRRNRAAVRYWVWLAASVKFLIPLSWLMAIGSWFEWRSAPVVVSNGFWFSVAVEQVFVPQPFVAAPPVPAVPAPMASSLPALLIAIWALGVVAVLYSWWRQWQPIRSALHRATPLPQVTTKIAVMSSSDMMEPGIVGLRRPVLLLPEGIAARLEPSQLNAIVVHELCHVRRRDNLAAAVHMAVEALYWFPARVVD